MVTTYLSPRSIYGGCEFVKINYDTKEIYRGNTASTAWNVWDGLLIDVKNRKVLENIAFWFTENQGFCDMGRA